MNERLGIYLFGGKGEGDEIFNDLWFGKVEFQPGAIPGRMELDPAHDTVYVDLKKLDPAGRPPVARYGHTMHQYKHLLMIHGGRNDHLYGDYYSVGLNDVCVYSIDKNEWMTISM